MDTIEELRERIKAVPTGVGGRRNFDAGLRADIVRYSKKEIAAGVSQNDIATRLGMKAWTLNRWHQNERKRVPGFVEVTREARAQPGAEAFEVTCRSGHEVRVPSSFETEPLRRLVLTLESV